MILFIMFCQAFIFSLYLSCYFIFSIYFYISIASRRRLFYCDFMNLVNKVKDVTANVDKPLVFAAECL